MIIQYAHWILHWILLPASKPGQLHLCQRHGCGGGEGVGVDATPRAAATAGAGSLRCVCATEKLGGGDGDTHIYYIRIQDLQVAVPLRPLSNVDGH